MSGRFALVALNQYPVGCGAVHQHIGNREADGGMTGAEHGQA